MWLKNEVVKLIKKHNTSDPFEIATQKNIYVIKWDLHEQINGYYKYDRRNRYIVINCNLDDDFQRVVCAHELGHAILHTRVNTPFMTKNTFFSVNKIEREANRFAAELLIPDDSLQEYDNIYEIASMHRVPIELVRLKYEKFFSL